MDYLPENKQLKYKPADRFILKQKSMVGRLNGLKGMAWSFALLYHTGLTASTASKKFSSNRPTKFDKKGNVVITNNIHKYLKGERAPILGPRGKEGFDVVNEVNKDPLGRLAAPWLTQPVWDILHPQISLLQIRIFLAGLPKEFTQVAFSDFRTPVMFNRVEDPRPALKILYKMGTFEAYTGILALLRESNLTGNKLLNQHAWRAHSLMNLKLLSDPVFQYIHLPFIHYVETFNGYYTRPTTPEKFEAEPSSLPPIDITSRFGSNPFEYLYLLTDD